MLGSPLMGGGLALVVLGILLTFLVVPLGLALLIAGIVLVVVGLGRGRGRGADDAP